MRLIVLALLLLFAPATAAARTQDCGPVDVRAMSYNIRLDLASDKANAWPYRRNELTGQIAIIRPDIVGMQEVLSSQRRDIMQALPGYEMVGVGRDDGRNAGEYSPLAISRAKFDVMESGTFWLSPTPEQPSLGWDAAYKRIVTWARLMHKATGMRMLVLNTHWDHMGMTARRESGSLIRRWIGSHRKNDEPLLLLGDFNAPLTEQSVKTLTDAGLRDTRAAAMAVSGSETTFNAFQPIPPAAAAIDHIFVGQGWTVRRHATIAQNVDGRVPSDHFPIVADLAATSPRCPG